MISESLNLQIFLLNSVRQTMKYRGGVLLTTAPSNSTLSCLLTETATYYWWMPAGPSRAGLFAHGFSATKKKPAVAKDASFTVAAHSSSLA